MTTPGRVTSRRPIGPVIAGSASRYTLTVTRSVTGEPDQVSLLDEADRCECEMSKRVDMKEEEHLRGYPAYTGRTPPSYTVVCAPQPRP